MQVSGPVQGVSIIPRRRRLEVLVAIAAIVVIAAVVALMVWVVPLTTSGVGAEDAISKASAGSAIIHDDAGNLPTDAEWAAGPRGLFYPGKVAPSHAGAGSAVLHDDAGQVRPR